MQTHIKGLSSFQMREGSCETAQSRGRCMSLLSIMYAGYSRKSPGKWVKKQKNDGGSAEAVSRISLK
jgi:hypothetical protein